MFYRLLFFALTLSTFVPETIAQISSSKLVLSSRWFHPRGKDDTLNTLEAIKRFNPSRLDWTYASDTLTTNLYHRLNIPFSLTINPMVADSLGHTSQKMRVRNFKGELYVAPFMKEWKIKTLYWGCVNNPEFSEIFYAQSLKLNALGPYAIMVDCPEFNATLKMEKIGGCFCGYCINKFAKTHKGIGSKRKFKKALKTSIIAQSTPGAQKAKIHSDYEKFQEESVTAFLLKWKGRMLLINPELKFLCNNFNGKWESYHQVFDGGVAELNENMITEQQLDKLYKKADELKKTQVFNSNSNDPAYHEKLLRYQLSHNRDAMIPWDVYVKETHLRYNINYNRFEEIYREYQK